MKHIQSHSLKNNEIKDYLKYLFLLFDCRSIAMMMLFFRRVLIFLLNFGFKKKIIQISFFKNSNS